MPRYELALILKIMQRKTDWEICKACNHRILSFLCVSLSQPETAAALKRTMETLMKHGAVVRNLENLGEKSLPYKISKHSERHSRGGYFLVDLEAPPTLVTTMLDHLARDIDVIRPTFLRQKLSKPLKECAGMVQPDYEAKLRSRRK